MVPPGASILATAADALPPTQLRPSLGAGSPAWPAGNTRAGSEARRGHFHHLSSSSSQQVGGWQARLPCKQQLHECRSAEASRHLQRQGPAQQQVICLVLSPALASPAGSSGAACVHWRHQQETLAG